MTGEITQQIFITIGKVVVVGTASTGFALVLMKQFAKSWLDNKFAQKLEVAKSELARELEAAKSEISILSARRLKLHDKEYVVFPELWAKLNAVVNSLNQTVTCLKRTPDFVRIDNEQLSKWLAESSLTDDEKSYFNQEADKGKAYSRIMDWKDLLQAMKDADGFHLYFQENKIFLNPQIKDKLSEIDAAIREALISRQMDFEGYTVGDGHSFFIDASETIAKQVKPLMAEIELLVQNNIFPPTSISTAMRTTN